MNTSSFKLEVYAKQPNRIPVSQYISDKGSINPLSISSSTLEHNQNLGQNNVEVSSKKISPPLGQNEHVELAMRMTCFKYFSYGSTIGICCALWRKILFYMIMK